MGFQTAVRSFEENRYSHACLSMMIMTVTKKFEVVAKSSFISAPINSMHLRVFSIVFGMLVQWKDYGNGRLCHFCLPSVELKVLRSQLTSIRTFPVNVRSSGGHQLD